MMFVDLYFRVKSSVQSSKTTLSVTLLSNIESESDSLESLRVLEARQRKIVISGKSWRAGVEGSVS